MLVGYEVQYQFFHFFAGMHARDHTDTAISNVFGCAAAVVSACVVSYYIKQVHYYYDIRILEPDADHPAKKSCIGNLIYNILAFAVRFENMIGLGRYSDRLRLDLESKLSSSAQSTNSTATNQQPEGIKLEPQEENLILETIVGSQDMNIWSILMPALYQLVPGSMIAKLWFNYIFPPPLIETRAEIYNTEWYYTTYQIDEDANNVFAGLMIISTSLALGLVVGFALVHMMDKCLDVLGGAGLVQDKLKTDEKLLRAKSRRAGMYSAPPAEDDNPDSVAQELRKALLGEIKTVAEADKIFNAIDVDRSNLMDEEEVTYYMLKAGLSQDQIQQLFAAMDKDGNGEVSREEFRRAILDQDNKNLLKPKEDVIVEESPVMDPRPEKEEDDAELASETKASETKGLSQDVNSNEFTS